MTKIFAHRGSAGTHPENTMAAFNEAFKVGADGIELDVQLTKDNQLVVIHDATVDRTTNGKGKVRDFNLQELQKLSAGAWFSSKYKHEKIPTLTEVLEWMADKDLLLNIELKYPTSDLNHFEEKVLQDIKTFNFENRVIISSFNHDGLKKVKQLNPRLECGILYLKRLHEPWNYAKTIGAQAIHPIWKVTDEEIIKQAVKNDITVRVFTVNKKKHLIHFIKIACPAIITDYPERAIKIRDRMTSQT